MHDGQFVHLRLGLNNSKTNTCQCPVLQEEERGKGGRVGERDKEGERTKIMSACVGEGAVWVL